MTRGLLLALLLLLLDALPATAATPPDERCTAPADLLDLGQPLPRLAARLAQQETATIVALGSSSTSGIGASAPDRTYPALLKTYWRQQFGTAAVTIHNRGIAGQDVGEMNLRLHADVISLKPDLVLWQLGTNAVLRMQGVEVYRDQIRRGIDTVKAAGIDVVLIDLQYAARVLQDPDHGAMQAMLAELAHERQIGLFRRFALMRYWLEQGGLRQDEILDSDGLHMNDLGYACLAEALAHALRQAAAGVGREPAVSTRR